MFQCSVCVEEFGSNQLLLRHLKDVHSDLKLFRCKESNCQRTFSIFRSFCRHRFRDHNLEYNFTNIMQPTDNAMIDSHALDRPTVSYDINRSYESFETDVADENGDENNIFNFASPLSNENDMRAIKKKLLGLYAKLYNFNNIPRNTIDEIICMFGQVSMLQLNYFKNRVDKKFQCHELYPAISECTTEITTDFSLLLDDMHNEHTRFKAFENYGTLIQPETIEVGERREYKTVDDSTIYKLIPITTDFVPIRKVLQTFFELDGMLDETLAFMNNLKANHRAIIQNFVQGPLWNKTEQLFRGKIVLPVFLYFDEYEPNNPLGSHKGLNKCGALYISVGFLPDKYHSKLENIFLLQLFNPLDRHSVSKEMLFDRTLKELQYLEQHGLTINCNSDSIQIYFSLGLIIGDNLGLHWILGFEENFSSHYFCRFCLTHYSQINSIFHEEDSKLRNIADYTEGIKIKNIALSGINDECMFNKLLGYHAIDNLYVDIFHDLLEGILRYDMAYIIDGFIKSEYFSLVHLNIIIKAFRYDTNTKNKPVEITISHLKNKYIVMSASEMLTLVTYFSLMIGHLIPLENEVWDLFLSLKKIIDICTSHKITHDTPSLLQVEIQEYLVQRNDLFPGTLKPKHNFLIHYPRVMKLIGPLANVSTSRYEGKHQEGKQAARAANSRKNINHTIAMRHQLKLNYRFFSGSTVLLEFKIGPYSPEKTLIPIIVSMSHINISDLKILKWIKRHELIIKRGTILILSEPDGPQFYEVYCCCYCQQSEQIFVVTKILQCVYFDKHFDAYKIFINESAGWKMFTPSQIQSAVATITCKIKLDDSYYYIPKR